MIREIVVGLSMFVVGSPLAATQVANGSQIIENFEGYALGSKSIVFCDVAYPAMDCLGTLSGGSITTASSVFPDASTGTQVYTGTTIGLTISDYIDYSWPAVSAYVTGTQPISLRIWSYDSVLNAEVEIAALSTTGAVTNFAFGYGDELNNLFLTRFEYSSDAVFSIDNLAMGLFDVGPGIPEPSSWMMLIMGFGLVGAISRRKASNQIQTPNAV